jgi:Transcriptional regulators
MPQKQRTFRYEQIAGSLRDRIARGDFAEDGRLPSERSLTAEFNVQRNTVRRALDLLVTERCIVRDAARGTFVSPRAARAVRGEQRGGGSGVSAGRPETAPIGSVLLGVRRDEASTAPADLMRGLAHALGERGYPVLWHDTRDLTAVAAEDSAVAALVDDPLAHHIEGAVIWAETPAPVARLRRLRDTVPLVLVDRRVPGFESDFVGFDDFGGGFVVTEHLIRLGHRRIGFLSGEPEAATVQGRARGYAAALTAAGISPQPDWVLHQQGGVKRIPASVLDAYLNSDGEPLTAVVCSNDLVAALLIRYLRMRERRVPEDVAVTGFGNLLPAVMDAFGVTTVAQPFEQVGRLSGEILLERLEERARRKVISGVRDVELPMQLIVRESCGAHLGPQSDA